MPSFLQAHASLLRRRPLIVGTLTGVPDLDRQLRAARSAWVDLVEVRLDTFAQLYAADGAVFADALVRRVRQLTRKPLLLTLRSHTERGSAAPRTERLSDAQREALLAPLLPLAALVDVEARRPAFARRVTRLARRWRVGVIHSFHDFRTGGRGSELDRWCAASRRAGADIFKVAVTPKDEGQLSAFLTRGAQWKNIGRILIGMGPVGAPSRTLGFSFGSLLTYGHLGEAAAPGQVAAAALGRAVRDIYGVKR